VEIHQASPVQLAFCANACIHTIAASLVKIFMRRNCSRPAGTKQGILYANVCRQSLGDQPTVHFAPNCPLSALLSRSYPQQDRGDPDS